MLWEIAAQKGFNAASDFIPPLKYADAMNALKKSLPLTSSTDGALIKIISFCSLMVYLSLLRQLHLIIDPKNKK